MADLDYYGADYGAEQPSRFMDAARNFGFANWAGAITSLGLTAGLAAWAVDMTVRDVSGVPVIAALEGPMREAPENPGGKVAPFQGLALSDITSGGPAAPAPDRIVLAPPPVSLDAPALSERMAATTAQTELQNAETDLQIAEADPERTEPELVASIQMALAEAVGDGVVVGASAPAAQVVPPAPASTEPQTPVVAEVAAISPSGPGVARSARPQSRPAGLSRAVAQAPVTLPTDAPAQEAGTQVASLDATVPSSRDVDGSTLTPGTRVVQLGAYDSESAARGEWDRMEARFRDYMRGKGRLVQKATSGGRDFWRLRVVGFEDGGEARRFCAELLAKDAACIPVTIR
ncbi:Sporulation related domain-containing protein [Jannaschia faecimaris]|uniref:Sporulation related domain-containing protein n=1 Tax=Jannaschia faecimaris TaxID=1244108 RepID=A0A1H3QI02_9RHOB|nr:SPOR domain-containing protein [Jannaschia faecimaris]SDZ13214.1 Sporulation related domain-containing protein [Jannaschia faecimaris]